MTVDEHVSRCCVQARSAAVGTGLTVQKFREFFAYRAGFGFTITPVKVRDHAFETMPLAHLHAARVLVEEIDLVVAAAEQNSLLQLVIEFLERRFNVELVVRRETLDHLVVVSGSAIPAANRATSQRQRLIDDDPLGIEKLLDAEAVASRACA